MNVDDMRTAIELTDRIEKMRQLCKRIVDCSYTVSTYFNLYDGGGSAPSLALPTSTAARLVRSEIRKLRGELSELKL